MILVTASRFFLNNTIKQYQDCLKLDIKFIMLLLLETTNFLFTNNTNRANAQT